MIVPFKSSSLYVTPPIREMAEGSVETLAFDAKEAVASTTAELVNLWTGERVPLTSAPSGPNISNVLVQGQKRGSSYDVLVTFVTAAGRTYSRALYVPVNK